MAWLAYCGGTRELQDGSEIVIGSGAQAGWRVQGLDLRARHFVIWRSDDEWALRPYSAQDVVALNGRQLSQAVQLQDGDRIAAGNGVFEFWHSEPLVEPSVSERPAVAYLVEDRACRAYPLAHTSTCIGTDDSNHLQLAGRGLASFHAEIRREAGGYALHAMGSSDTRVNDRRCVTPCLLDEGDRVQVGESALRFTFGPLPEGLRLGDGKEQHDATSAPLITFAASDSAGERARTPRGAARTLAGIATLLLLLAAAAAFLR